MLYYLLGYGLPTTLSPERIKDVLDLARSHTRELVQALDRDAAPAWKRTDPDADFYARLQELIRTADGRKAYEKAKRDFESAKPKRSGRADLIRRLGKDCYRRVLDPSQVDSGKRGELSPDVKEKYAEENAWGHLAEFEEKFVEAGAWEFFAELLWAEGVLQSGIGDGIVKALDEFPDLAPYLEEVQAGLVPVDDPLEESEPEEEAVETLVADFKKTAADIEVKNLDFAALEKLSRLTSILIVTAKAQKNKAEKQRRDEADRLRERISDWRQRHVAALIDAPELNERLAALDRRIDDDGMDRDRLDTVLGRCEAVFDIEARFQETNGKYKKAVAEDDYTEVSSLATALESLKSERDAAYADIDSMLSEPSPERPERSEREPDTSQGTKQKTVTTPDGVDEDDTPRHDGLEEQGTAPKQAPAPDLDPTPPRSPEPTDGEEPIADSPDTLVGRIERAVEMAIEHDRFGVAYHLALAEPEILPSANAIKLVACNYVTDERTPVAVDDLANELLGEVKTVLGELDLSTRCDYAALITSAALMPALTAVSGPVAQLLEFLEPHLDRLSALRKLAAAAAQVSMKGVLLPAELLREDESLEKWREQESLLRDETKKWIESQRGGEAQIPPRDQGLATDACHLGNRISCLTRPDFRFAGRTDRPYRHPLRLRDRRLLAEQRRE